MIPRVAHIVDQRCTRNEPTRMMNSPINPLRPGRPIEENVMIRKNKVKHTERIEKLELQINLTEKTRDYNLGTSLRNYIDPRIFKTWTDEGGAEWEKLYTSALQKKFLWVKNTNSKWSQISKEY